MEETSAKRLGQKGDELFGHAAVVKVCRNKPIELLWGVKNHRLKGFFQGAYGRKAGWIIPFQVGQYGRFLWCPGARRSFIAGQNPICGIAIVRGNGAKARSFG